MSEPRIDAFQTQTVIRGLLSEAGVKPRKRFGQHFLVDRNLMMKLVDAAELDIGDCVLEVGPGTGSLTGLLMARAGHVVAVEVDSVLAALLQRRLQGAPHVTFLHTDVLAGKSAIAPAVLNALREHGPASNRRLKLVANLPYDVATALVINLLLADLAIDRLCFTVQKEVAARFMSPPGGADYGSVAILSQVQAHGIRIASVPASAFWPPPKVHSTMLRLDPIRRSDSPVKDPRRFAEFVRAFFLHRRQTLGRIVRRLPDADQLQKALEQLAIDPVLRPQNLTVEQWISLYRQVR